MIYLKAKYTWKDTGWRAVQSAVAKASGAQVRAGVVGPDASRQHPNADITIGEVAMVNEFGSDDGHVPRRSFIRDTFLNKRRLFVSLIAQAATKVIHGRVPADAAFAQLGAIAVEMIRQTIDGFVSPGNADATVDKKGFNHPLIEDGVLKDSISFQVVRGKNTLDRGAVGGDYESFEVGT